ncbi:AAA domain-containing protein [Dunaliella salina]|uniref:AAA domain-containing protein n=1 Tax=Dunaliella salina TaxID=3046 RepID=A0ABQ7G6L1_DUNSA|nr:AAA domain-containing protein [Dunaliella salina]|eukprot:KAF5830241.1 AAA domain-containing protein [Dunaliella salina]
MLNGVEQPLCLGGTVMSVQPMEVTVRLRMLQLHEPASLVWRLDRLCNSNTTKACARALETVAREVHSNQLLRGLVCSWAAQQQQQQQQQCEQQLAQGVQQQQQQQQQQQVQGEFQTQQTQQMQQQQQQQLVQRELQQQQQQQQHVQQWQLFGQQVNQHPPDVPCLPGCNASQSLAVLRASEEAVTLIHGPPGSGKVTEPRTLLPLIHGAQQLVLVGDPKQLGPCVQSVESAALGVTLFERLIQVGAKPILLDVQYRMHAAIAAFPNKHFYGGRLKTATPAAAAAPLPWPLAAPLTFLDVAEGREEGCGTSKINHAEAKKAVALCTQLMQGRGRGGLRAAEIGVISPYKEMVLLLRQMLAGTGIEVDTVDAMQGREKEVTLICTVRSNFKGFAGRAAAAEDGRRRVRALRGMASNPPDLQ